MATSQASQPKDGSLPKDFDESEAMKLAKGCGPRRGGSFVLIVWSKRNIPLISAACKVASASKLSSSADVVCVSSIPKKPPVAACP